MWYTTTEAAAKLGVSDRTMRRRLQAGQYPTRRDGRAVLVDLPDVSGEVADVGRQMAEVGAAAAVARSRDADILEATLAAFGQADKRAARTAIVSAMLLIAVVGVAAYGAWRYHETTLTHTRTVFALETSCDTARTATAATRRQADLLRSERDTARTNAVEAETAMLSDNSRLRERIAELQRQNVALRQAERFLGMVETVGRAAWLSFVGGAAKPRVPTPSPALARGTE